MSADLPASDGPPEDLAGFRPRDSMPSLPPGLREAAMERIAAKRGPLTWLRERPTGQRRALALALVGACVASGLLSIKGSGALAILFGAVAAGGAWLSLQPLHQPEVPRATRWLATAGAVALVVALAFLDPLAEPAPVAARLKCFVPGATIALGVYVVWRALSRRPAGFASFAGATAAGLTANGFLAARCGAGDWQHMLLGHASVLGVLLVLAFLLEKALPAR
ncbi:MAG: hypothetical protein AAGH15_21970 [Myxococcota bacterium]